MINDIKNDIKEAEKCYQEGIYFDMSFKQYCSLPYFSRSLSKEVLFDLEEVKYRMTNPIEETPAMALGTAIHSMLLEPEDFKKTYVKEPKPEDFNKTILKTSDDFKKVLKSVGEKVTGKKEDLIKRVKEFIDPENFIIWDEFIGDFHQKVLQNNQKILTDADFETLEAIRHSYAIKNDIPLILQNGKPEVTIIWRDEETGIMCKCRLDYVRPEAIGDVKSFSVKDKSKSLFEYLFRQTTNYYYNYQFAIYSEALENIIKKINCNKVKYYGEVDSKWIEEFLKTPQKQFFIVYVRTAPPYQMKAVELERSDVDGGSLNSYYEVAQKNWRLALKKFERALNTGVWKEKELAVLEDSHVPNVIYQESIL